MSKFTPYIKKLQFSSNIIDSDFDLKEINNLDIQGNNININIKERINKMSGTIGCF